MRLWYENTAAEWAQALPMGNGHLGAMAYGGAEGRFDLTEATCWSGCRQENVLKSGAADSMRRARKELIRGNIEAGEALMADCDGIKGNYGTQLPLATLFVGVQAERNGRAARELDLRTGICTDRLAGGQTAVLRESFVSNPDKVMAVRLSAGGKALPDVAVRLQGLGRPESAESESAAVAVSGRAFEEIHSDGRHGVFYLCRFEVRSDGMAEAGSGEIRIRGAREVVVYLAAATDLFGDGLEQLCEKRTRDAADMGWNGLRRRHVCEHARWMDRCSLELPEGRAAALPTDRRLQSCREGADEPGLAALLFQYGRYLLLNSSRPDSRLPAALQGVWSDGRACRMEWTDDMHLDINTQLNYYPAEATGLGECCEPLFRWISTLLAPEGEKIARELYDCSGWVAHTISNAYGWAAPGWGGVSWQFNVSGGAWAATHLWFHYLYTGDREFLRKYYPVLRGAAEFLYNLLLPDPESGELLVTPSYSPENSFLLGGKTHAISAGGTCDTLIAKYLFAAVGTACGVLGLEDGLAAKLRDAAGRLPPFRVGKHGQLQEWNRDYDEAFPDHRHMSHLLCVYPFGQVNPDDTPALAQAARVTFARRMAVGAEDIVNANWSAALSALYYARLRDGRRAGEMLRHLICDLSQENLTLAHRSGIYELDGNTGFTAGAAEMLLQSYRGEIHVLPALPADWPSGRFSGLIAEGGHSVAASWENGLPVNISVTAGRAGRIRLRFGDAVAECGYESGRTRSFTYRDGKLAELSTDARTN